jgi:hypothetical protein
VYGEDAAVRVGGGVDAECEEDLGDVGFDGAVGEVELGADRLVRAAFGDEGEDLMLALEERGEWIVVAVPAEQAKYRHWLPGRGRESVTTRAARLDASG